MLNKPVDNIVYNSDGTVRGIESEGETVECDLIVCDPSYAPDQCKKTGSVIRAICILNHPIKHTDNSNSCQIIIPRGQINRQNDIYIASVSHSHGVTASPWFLAIASTVVETSDPQRELKPALSMLEPIDRIFYDQSDLFEPQHDGSKNRLFISKSYDATSHFETTCNDIVDMYRRITGHDIDLSKVDDLENSNE
ncbi:hypothetical protein GJ496_011840 [Pomphorhynchus laevis]|nr:hypothetical protein GJ496_011840 [Pomphorhynchus laevis]